MNLYGDDLAYIHDAGFGDLARDAARRLVEELRGAGLRAGTVVDLGCGSGLLARHLTDAGYSVVGVDVSEAMIAIARARVPEAEFRVGSFVSAELPPCVAVTAIGEVLNYTFDDRNDRAARDRMFRRSHERLQPGGVMMLDLAGPERLAPGMTTRTFEEGPDWAVLVLAEADRPTGALTRTITSFRRSGDLYRRDRETHRLTLIDPAEISESLRGAGFSVRSPAGYGPRPFLPGIAGFVARKLSDAAA